METAKLERLAAAGINLVPVDLERYYLLERDGFIALVERVEAGFGRVGTAGLLTEKGLAPLVWRNDESWFVARGFEQRASVEQVESLRAFQRDLQVALGA
jgi:hypothetical protein